MDRVRLGRVLGRGARMAARTVYDAVDAATSNTPSASDQPQSRVAIQPPHPVQPGRAAASTANVRATLQQATRTAERVHGSARAARQGVLAPVKRASRAVSLEIAGSFFALFALSFGVAAWRFRGLFQAGSSQRLWIYIGFATLFGYFAVSSFLRARRLTKG